MKKNNYLNPLDTSNLFGFDYNFNELVELYEINKLPKVLMLSGKKGLGKITFVYHFLNFVYDKKNYDLKNKKIDKNSKFNRQLLNNVFENIIYLKNYDSDKIKIEDVRNLKKKVLKSSINDGPRFVIIDDAELLTPNTANGLLKIIEEPADNNFFILIDNKTVPIIDTIASRCLKINIFFSNSERINIINNLIKIFNIESVFDYKSSDISPGLFLVYNSICLKNDIKTNMNLMLKLDTLFKLYKKTKEKSYIEISKYFVDQYFFSLSLNNNKNIFMINKIKIKTINFINDFVLYNLNLNLVLNSINSELFNEK